MAQDEVRRKSRELRAQRAVLPQAPLEQPPLPVQAQRVSPRERELLVQELLLARAPHAQELAAWVLQPRVPEYAVLPEPVLAPLAWPPQVDEQAQAEQQQEPPLEEKAFAKLPSPPLLSPSARLPPRFRRPLHPAGDA
ncbi:MAG TPA: hypothetical protein VNU20_07065 [Candidatus Sulfotelmatobacter sp.]|nr:hypothetical protein [Candidatus Sulfotelmatobacter sp.]